MRIGIDIGGTNLVAGVVNDKFELIDKVSAPSNSSRPDTEIVNDIIALCEQVIKKNNINSDDVESIGIGVPGCYDSDAGIILHCDNINFHNTSISKMIQEKINVPVFLGNDADCAALGEAYSGATKDALSSVMITIGTGIGGGIIINKKIYNGFNSSGGEVGHMVIDVNGEKCNCGRRGCWELYGSATALIKQTQKAITENPGSIMAGLVNGDAEKAGGKTPFDAMRAGCPVGKAVVEKFVEYFSVGVTNIVNIFQPEMIVIGGGVSKEGQPLIDMITKHVSSVQYGKETELPKTTLCTAVLGNDAGVIGAALLAL